MTLADQDALVERIRSRLPDSEILDRQQAPNHGYRAVHFIVKVDGMPVEIQI
jgi:ppGpp synthetase/RelA/SpoT-type nucleotidyltranferase